MVIAFAVVDDSLSNEVPFDDEIERFFFRHDAEDFIRVVRRDDPEVAAKFRIEERELEAGGRN